MRRLALLPALCLLLVGCAEGQPHNDERTAADTFDADDYEPDLADDDNGTPLYVTVSRDAYPSAFAPVDDQLMIDAVEETCDRLDAGVSAFSVIFDATEAVGFDPDLSSAMGYLIGAGVASECAQHQAALEALS